jgi:adenosylmethionine-8-amino-7-oxononanoate aminotransferase
LELFAEEKVLENAVGKAERIRVVFGELADLPGVTRARAFGMVGALELEGVGYHALSGWRGYREARRRGALLRPIGNVVYVAPALNIEARELDELLEILGESVRAVASGEEGES